MRLDAIGKLTEDAACGNPIDGSRRRSVSVLAEQIEGEYRFVFDLFRLLTGSSGVGGSIQEERSPVAVGPRERRMGAASESDHRTQ